MSRLNTAERVIHAVQRQSTIVDPRVKLDPRIQVTAHHYVTVPTIDTRGSWPVTHMIPEDTFVEMAILAGHIQRRGTNRKGFRV